MLAFIELEMSAEADDTQHDNACATRLLKARLISIAAYLPSGSKQCFLMDFAENVNVESLLLLLCIFYIYMCTFGVYIQHNDCRRTAPQPTVSLTSLANSTIW